MIYKFVKEWFYFIFKLFIYLVCVIRVELKLELNVEVNFGRMGVGDGVVVVIGSGVIVVIVEGVCSFGNEGRVGVMLGVLVIEKLGKGGFEDGRGFWVIEKSEGIAVDRLRGKGVVEIGMEVESFERTVVVELGWGIEVDVIVVDEVVINDFGRDIDGLRDGLLVKGKLLVKEVKGGRVVNIGVMGVEELCGGRDIEERGFEIFKGVFKLESFDNVGLR